MRRGIIVLFLLSLSACGKEAAPLPPFIRIPEAVKDLRVAQNGYSLVLTWTSPAKNIDGSAATNLAHVRIRSGSTTVTTVSAAQPGQPQSYSISLDSALDGRRTFTVVVDTTQGKNSEVSNAALIIPVQVPGRVANLRNVVDQRRIMLEWDKPQEHPELADAYVIVRSDMPGESQTVSETRYGDEQYQPGKVLTYQVTAIRRVGGNIVTGIGPESITFTVVDTTPPQIPTGLDIVQSETGAYLTWNPNSETDLAGYRVFRADSANSEFRPMSDSLITTNAFFDPAYRPGQYYRVSAVDELGNASAMSEEIRGQ